jgi:hypothetical protein
MAMNRLGEAVRLFLDVHKAVFVNDGLVRRGFQPQHNGLFERAESCLKVCAVLRRGVEVLLNGR